MQRKYAERLRKSFHKSLLDTPVPKTKIIGKKSKFLPPPLVPTTYLPTLPVFPGVSKFFMKSPGLPVRAPNLPGTTYRGSFCISYSLIS